MTIWQHLFVGDLEYAPAADILAGLTPLQAGMRPEGMHSIFEELFHAAGWQETMLVSAKGGSMGESDADWPATPAPPDEGAWTGLVASFLAGSEEAGALGSQTERHDEVLPEGRSVRERLELLAVHNAYHMGKIVALRRFLGFWNPPPTSSDAL